MNCPNLEQNARVQWMLEEAEREEIRARETSDPTLRTVCAFVAQQYRKRVEQAGLR
jgi:hypothetical protein